MTPGLREVEDAALFSSQSISGEELGIERFYSKDSAEREGRQRGRQRCVRLCVRGNKRLGRGGDKLMRRGEVRCDKQERKRCSISAVRASRNHRQPSETTGRAPDAELPR